MAQGWTLFCARARYIVFAAVCLLPARAAAASTAELLENLKSPQPEVRAQAMDALMRSKPEAVPDLVRWVRGASSRRVVSRILAEMGPKAVPPLLELLDDPEVRTRSGGLLFQSVQPGQSHLAPKLLDCVRSKPEVKHYCGTALVKVMTPAAGGQTGRLIKALKDQDADVRYYAAASLGQAGIGGREVALALAVLLKDPDLRLRAVAVEALGKLGRKARVAAPALREAAQAEKGQLRQEMLDALKRLNG